MNSSILKAFVYSADNNNVCIKVIDNSLIKKLENIGFRKNNNDFYEIVMLNDKDKGELFSILRDMGICFSSGKEWCPAEVFEYLRDLGLVSGNFNRIAWFDYKKYKITKE